MCIAVTSVVPWSAPALSEWLEAVHWTAAPLGKVAVLVVLGAILYRVRVMDKAVIDAIARVVVALTLPCLIATTILARFRPQELLYRDWYVMPLGAAAMIAAVAALAYPIARTGRRWLRPRCTVAALAFHNAGYLVIPILAEIYGRGEMLQYRQDMLALLFLFILGISPLMWSLGVAAMRDPAASASLPFWQRVISPPLIANIVAITACLAGLPQRLPDKALEAVLSPFRLVGDCTVPLMMLVLGAMLMQLDRSHRPGVWLAGAALLLRLVLFPAVAFGLIHALLAAQILDRPKAIILFIESAMPTAVGIAVIARRYGDEQTAHAVGGLVFWEYVAAAATIPFWLILWGLYEGYQLG